LLPPRDPPDRPVQVRHADTVAEASARVTDQRTASRAIRPDRDWTGDRQCRHRPASTRAWPIPCVDRQRLLRDLRLIEAVASTDRKPALWHIAIL
jgi:hypothetical protein